MKHMRTRIALALCAAAIATTAPAYAQGRGGGQGGGGNAPASMGSMQQGRGMDAARDQDKDQTRSQDKDRLNDRDRLYLGAKDRIRQHDKDQDGKINRQEFDDWRGASFGVMDADGNGLTMQEYLAVRLGPGPYKSGNTARQQQKQEQADLRKTARFRVMDGDGNGVVTRTEYMKFGELNYLEADANDDGQLTFKELQQFHRGT